MNNMIEIISSDYYKEMYDLKIIKWYLKKASELWLYNFK